MGRSDRSPQDARDAKKALSSKGWRMFQKTIRKHLYPFRNRPGDVVTGKSAQSGSRIEQEWSIGIYQGTTPLNLSPPTESQNPVLTLKDVSDVSAKFVADPFMIRTGGKWHMFFEVLSSVTGKGQIGLATSNDGFRWDYRRIVLAESFHLSYPYVFEWKGEHFMIPESFQAGSIRLYKAEKFPDKWSFQCNIMDGGVFLDPSVVHFEGKWWLFVETSPQEKYDTLRLFYADELTGPWREHPMSPVVAANHRIARPAGRVQVVNGSLIRFAQDCYPLYGTRVRAFLVSELTTKNYRESECEESPILGPSGVGWNRSGMHHVDLHNIHNDRWISCVDGFAIKEFKG
jgi:hypothetical protein